MREGRTRMVAMTSMMARLITRMRTAQPWTMEAYQMNAARIAYVDWTQHSRRCGHVSTGHRAMAAAAVRGGNAAYARGAWPAALAREAGARHASGFAGTSCDVIDRTAAENRLLYRSKQRGFLELDILLVRGRPRRTRAPLLSVCPAATAVSHPSLTADGDVHLTVESAACVHVHVCRHPCVFGSVCVRALYRPVAP